MPISIVGNCAVRNLQATLRDMLMNNIEIVTSEINSTFRFAQGKIT